MAEEISLSRIDFGSDERFRSLRRSLGVEAFGLNQLTLQPGQRGRIHRHHRQEEVYLVLSGTLTLRVEDQPHVLSAGELARVPPELRRQLENRGRTTCVVVAIGAAGEHLGRDGEAFATWNDETGRAPQEMPLPHDLPASD